MLSVVEVMIKFDRLQIDLKINEFVLHEFDQMNQFDEKLYKHEMLHYIYHFQ